MIPTNGDGHRAGETRLTKADLIAEVCRVLAIPRDDAAQIVERILDGMVRAIRAGEGVEIRGFGSFHTRQRRARTGRNPKTGASVAVPPRTIAYFKPSKELRDLVNSASAPPGPIK